MSIVSALTIPPAQTLNAVGSGAADRQIVAAGAGAVPSVVYGEAIVTGRILNVLAAAGGSSLVVQVVWALGPIQSIDLPLYKDRALPAGATFTHYLGTAGQAVDAAMAAAMSAQSITYTATLAGVAYSVFVVPITGFDGSLKFTARVRGRLLYDPRKDSTVPGGSGAHRLSTPGTWEYSENPALADADWLRSNVYGCGVSVDWVSVMAAATACDAMIGSPAEKRRIIGLELDAARPVADVAEALRAYAGVWHVHVQASASAAAVKLVPDADAAAVASYSHAAGQILRFGPLQARDIGSGPTAVEVVYTDASKRPTRDAFARASVPGAGSTLPLRLSQVRLPGVTRYSQAMREATERLNKLRLGDLTAGIELLDEGIRHEVGDIINITHPVGLTAKPFRIAEPPQLVATGRWRAALVEHDPAVYSSAVQTVPSVPDTALVIGGGRPADWAALLNRPADVELLNSLAPKPLGAMNADPACERPTAWQVIGQATFTVIADSRAVGATCIIFPSTAPDNSQVFSAEQIPVNPTLIYNLTARFWVNTSNTRNMYLVVRMFKADGTEYFGDSTGWGGTYAGYVYGGAPAVDTFLDVGGDFGAGTARPMPAEVSYIRIGVWGQYFGGGGGTGAKTEQLCQNVRLTEVTAVRAAKSVADTAAVNATSALSTLQTMRSNGYLDASEKPALIRQWQAATNERPGIEAQATDYGLTAARNAYANSYSALVAYLNGLSPSWMDTTVDTPIQPATDQTVWANYYGARQTLLNAIAEEAGKRAVWASVTGAGRPQDGATVGAPSGTLVGNTLAQVVEGNASQALSTASAAASSATSALSTLQTMRSNGYLDASEKPALIRQWQAAANERPGIEAQATAYGLTAARNAYANAYSGLVAYLNGLSPSWMDTAVDTPITPATDQTVWANYYGARQTLLNAIAEEAGKRAIWQQVTGSGRPSDNATRDVALVATGGVSVTGNSLEKTGGDGGAWESAAYSLESYTGGAFVSFSPATSNLRFMVGLNTDPTFSDSWETLDYAIYCELGVLYAAESGTLYGVLATYTAGDSLAVTYDGATVKYFKNGSVIRSVAAVIVQSLYLDSSFGNIGARADRVVFGPMSAVRDIATSQLAPGAATESFYANPPDGNINGLTNGGLRHVIVTSSWTNQTSTAVVVELSLSFSFRAIDYQQGGSTVGKSIFGLHVSGAVTSSFGKTVPVADEMQSASITPNVSVPAGQTITIDVFVDPLRITGRWMDVFWADLHFRWAAIKR